MRLAHLTDLHLLESDGGATLRRRYLTFFRSHGAAARRAHALQGLVAARASGAAHVVLTGDLTEEGTEAQFEVLADVLAESGWARDRVTLLPGNHDRYAAADGWARALEGPLAPYAPTSRAGGVVEGDGFHLVPLDTTIHQSWTRSGGALDLDAVPELTGLGGGGRARVLAVHHPPFKVRTHAFHGLRNYRALHDRLAAHPEVHVLHGHIHRRSDRPVGEGEARVFSAGPCTVDPGHLRLYDVRDGRLCPAEPAGEEAAAK